VVQECDVCYLSYQGIPLMKQDNSNRTHLKTAAPGGRADSGVRLKLLDCWDSGSEYS
jgi:hypothetical protein